MDAAAGVPRRQAAEGLRAERAVLQGALAGYAGMLDKAAPRRAAELEQASFIAGGKIPVLTQIAGGFGVASDAPAIHSRVTA